MALDRQTLAAVDEWLTELEREAERLPARQYSPDESPGETALRVGRWQGVRDARAWIEKKKREWKEEG